MSPLLMIPGPIEVTQTVLDAFAGPPPSHVSPAVIEAFGSAVERMRQVWCAAPSGQPFVVAGSGTLAMEMGLCNVLQPGDEALLVNTGYFSDRLALMAQRRGVLITQVAASVGQAPAIDEVRQALGTKKFKALLVTHVDTSTGVRTDAAALSRLAREAGVLSIFDGVCATAGERFEMAEWQADIYLTASQKVIGLPAGLALLVASERALAARRELQHEPMLSIDFEQWQPIMKAYEQRRPSYFSTPATNLIMALDVSLGEQLEATDGALSGIQARFAQHQRAADSLRAAWRAMGLSLLPDADLAANTLSAIRYPEGVDSALPGKIKQHGVVVAGGLHPSCKAEYFRVGHMGAVVTQADALLKTVKAVAGGLADCGHSVDLAAATAAFSSAFEQQS